MGIDSGIYKLLLVLHILSAIVGFGTVFLNGLRGAEAKKRKGPEGLAIIDSTIAVSDVAMKVIYLVFVFGVALVLTSDDTWKFGHLWVGLSMGLFIIAMGLSHGVLRPTVHRMRALMAEMVAAGPAPGGPPPQVAEMEQRGRTTAVVSTTLNLILVTILVLMIWKPL